jgi:hypothetical protein
MDAIATRKYAHCSGSEIIVRVFAPEAKADDQWICRFEIAGPSKVVEECGYGIDGVQALQVALEGVRVRLSTLGNDIAFLGGEPGELGLPRPIPWSYGLDVYRQLERIVDAEVARLIAQRKGTSHRE